MDPGGGIHPVGGLHQAHHGDGFQLGLQRHRRDPVAHGVDARPVFRMKEAGVLAEGLGEPACLGLHLGQFSDDGGGPVRPDLAVGLHIGGGQGVGIAVVVVRPDPMALRLQGMAHAGAAGEEVADGPALGQDPGYRIFNWIKKGPFRAQVFDHKRLFPWSGPYSGEDALCLSSCPASPVWPEHGPIAADSQPPARRRASRPGSAPAAPAGPGRTAPRCRRRCR